MMLYETEKQTDTPAQSATDGRLIAFCAGSKGIGKTWLAATLSHSLALQKKKILFFDADCGLENISSQLELDSAVSYTKLITGHLTLNNAAFSFARGNFDIVSSFSGENGLAVAPMGRVQILAQDLSHFSHYYDAVFLDCSDEDLPTVNVFFNLCRTIVVLVNPDPVSLTEAYRKIVKLKNISPSAKLYVVINHAQSYEEGRQLYKLLLKAAEEYIKLDFNLLGVIRQDPHIREAVLNKELLLKRYPRCTGTQDSLLIAEALLKEVFV